MPAPTAIQSMAAAIVAMRPDAVLQDVRDKAVLCLTDYFSAAYEARALPWAQQAAALASSSPEGAACIALGRKAAPDGAAFANAVAAHGLVREDMHTGSISHFGVVVWPALLASLPGLDRAVSGAELLAAGAIGYEVGGVLGKALMSAELARLFRPTGLLGPVAAAAAVGHLHGLSADAMAAALGLAVNCASGLNQWPAAGGSDMYFHAGFAARNALSVVDLARAGAFAAPDILEGEAGMFRAFARRELSSPLVLFAAERWEIEAVFHKGVPACNYAQTPSQAAFAAVEQLSGDSRQVVGIDIHATRAALLYPGCDATGPFDNVLQAKMSIQYGVAAAVARHRIEAGNYARLDDPEVARLIGVTRLTEDPQLSAAYPVRQPARVELRLADGRVLTGALDDVQVATADDVGRRFRKAAAEALGDDRAAALDTFIRELGGASDIRALDGLQLAPS